VGESIAGHFDISHRRWSPPAFRTLALVAGERAAGTLRLRILPCTRRMRGKGEGIQTAAGLLAGHNGDNATELHPAASFEVGR